MVDTSLYETALAWMTIPIAAHLVNGEIPTRQGSGVDMIVPYQAFAAADGYIMVAAGNDNLFRHLCTAIARPDLAEDPRFRTNKDRVVNRQSLIPILEDIFAAEPIAAWAARLDAAGIPERPDADGRPGGRRCPDRGPRHDPASLGEFRRSRPLSLVGLPLSFDGVRPPFAKSAPALGEDNIEILDRGR